jgi:hypothetical protein
MLLVGSTSDDPHPDKTPASNHQRAREVRITAFNMFSIFDHSADQTRIASNDGLSQFPAAPCTLPEVTVVTLGHRQTAGAVHLAVETI